MTLHFRQVSAIEAVPASAWAMLHAGDNPFVTHRFLHTLEASGAVGPGTGWQPCHLLAEDATGRLLGAVPLYAKTHSLGEYVFDHGWAAAWERAGGQYYPKLLAAVPFTPVSGPRLLSPDPLVRAALAQALVQITTQQGLSSAHLNFTDDPTPPPGWLARIGLQYHWQNAGWRDYADFLDAMPSRKRKTLRRERAQAQAGVEIRTLTGAMMTPEHWEAMWSFYQHTGARKWGRPYLPRAWFELAARELADDVLVFMAFDGQRPIAGALNFIGQSTLYGRYWGCLDERPFLHFELCYHQAIDWALAHGRRRVEAGAQGEHKIARGYLPVRTHSAHWIAHPGFRAAIARFLADETAAVMAEMQALAMHSPFKENG